MTAFVWAAIFAAYLLLVGVIARSMREGVHTPPPPTTVRDPETGAVWTEMKRVDTWV